MTELIELERTTVALIALSPHQRTTLEDVVAWGCPVRLRDLVRVQGKDKMVVHKSLMALWTAGLVKRSGQHPVITYRGTNGLAGLLASFPPSPRKITKADHRDGVAILETARDLVGSRLWPSPGAIVDACGRPLTLKVCQTWSRRLKAAGLWPDVSGLHWTDVRAGRQRKKAASRKVFSYLHIVEEVLIRRNYFRIHPESPVVDDLRAAAREAIMDSAAEIVRADDRAGHVAIVAEEAIRRELSEARRWEFRGSDRYYSDWSDITPVDPSPGPDIQAQMREARDAG